MRTPAGSELPPSLWAATATPAPETPRLEGETTADVAIVGGGFTGLSAALHLTESGVDVALLESSEPGWGASGRNGGQIIPGLKHPPEELERRYGPERGRRVHEFATGTADFLFGLIARHGIECGAERTGWVRGAHTPAMAATVAASTEDMRRRGVPVEWLDKDTVRTLLGTDVYEGGMLDPRGGRVQPLSLARGIARVAQAKGARIHGFSPARRLTQSGDRWRLESDHGSVTAKQVLLATNAYTDELWPGLARSVIPVQSAQIATAPLGHNVRRTILPHGHVVSDTRRLLIYFRLDEEGRLLFGGRGSLSGGESNRARGEITAAMKRTFPIVGDAEIAFQWAGYVAVTPDSLPRVFRLAPGVIAALGYNGRGVAMSNALGAAVATALRDGRDDAVALPVDGLRTIPFHAARLPALALITEFYRLRDRLGV
jgi:glycine/D-amino acid oxidase-like deaminating enzyme